MKFSPLVYVTYWNSLLFQLDSIVWSPNLVEVQLIGRNICDPFKSEMKLHYVWRFSLQLTENILLFHYKNRWMLLGDYWFSWCFSFGFIRLWQVSHWRWRQYFSETSEHTTYKPKRRPPTGQQPPREPENWHEVVVVGSVGTRQYSVWVKCIDWSAKYGGT